MNAIELEIFRHLFASIAEEMGATLMRSAYSPNIKERRDFSCAIFDAAGEMVAQAAHIPVHLGSTPLSVRAAIDAIKMTPKMHVVLNDPFAGGTHLPDITMVSPVFDAAGEVRFYVANRAHHADVGGISPGSLGLSKSIDEEGIRISPTAWSEALEDEIAAASRTPQERRGDLRAQIAANRRGRQRLQEQLARQPEKVLAACADLQDYSERFMRRIIAQMPDGQWEFEDFLDDDGMGNGPLKIRCTLTISGDAASVDFRGTDAQTAGPLNVPRAVTLSAVLYVFRCLAPPELPSNGGYMRCVKLMTEPGSLVDAQYPAAVAAGNVETSQRITDVVIGAFSKAIPGQVPAASCGSMNNILIGGADPRRVAGGSAIDADFAYYETIGGGSGACPGVDGQGYAGESAVQTHMTNTLNTPVEALEHAYPFRVAEYRVRRGSGGQGAFRGGDGVVRAYEFDAPATVTLMTERRDRAPWGLEGGEDAKVGENLLVRDGVTRQLPNKCTVEVQAGDRVIIKTPGGAGAGRF
ncbi:hydantoinase B/oxoprolinase family protein [Bradymonas sediminis]|uniref:Hydantoinase B/oxoprolinase family protein n=1 Tax=Bradymonas sediminis TaxID=1548548 RepID=A0A2Z4FHR1_9DELT|nr:hydantoinase B/oxoprolinase family protein [Bradymonas sediminis]AWV88305.1 hydantoinase B/oxoprolinase family protein [Bradymonas sediminis]TDP77430.1 N-methylhydantoinase B [Bradymonas sediminis]